MDHPDPKISTKTTSRRRLVRGALAAPALLTVYSGSAFAGSSSLRCLSNANNPGVQAPAAWITSGTDGFLRVRLYRVKKTGQGAYTKYFVKGSDLGTHQRATGMPTSTQYLEIKLADYTTSGSPISTLPEGSTQYVNKYAALRFNSQGVCIGVGNGTTGGMVGQSCWVSALPNL